MTWNACCNFYFTFYVLRSKGNPITLSVYCNPEHQGTVSQSKEILYQVSKNKQNNRQRKSTADFPVMCLLMCCCSIVPISKQTHSSSTRYHVSGTSISSTVSYEWRGMGRPDLRLPRHLGPTSTPPLPPITGGLDGLPDLITTH